MSPRVACATLTTCAAPPWAVGLRSNKRTSTTISSTAAAAPTIHAVRWVRWSVVVCGSCDSLIPPLNLWGTRPPTRTAPPLSACRLHPRGILPAAAERADEVDARGQLQSFETERLQLVLQECGLRGDDREVVGGT